MKYFETLTIKDATFQDIVDFVKDHTPYCSGDFKISISTGRDISYSDIIIDIDYEEKTIKIYNYDSKEDELPPMNFGEKKC